LGLGDLEETTDDNALGSQFDKSVILVRYRRLQNICVVIDMPLEKISKIGGTGLNQRLWVSGQLL